MRKSPATGCLGWMCLLVLALVFFLLYLTRARQEGFDGKSSSVVIPRVVFQTSKTPQEDYVVDMVRQRSPGWEYRHFTDQDILTYFREHPLPEFDQIEAQFFRLHGAHRADLFRYYFLYVEGGVFLDSDAIITVPMDDVAKNYHFFSVESFCPSNPKSIFQGLIGAVPRNEIVYKALKDAYTVKRADLDANYHLLVYHLYDIYYETTYDYPTRLYSERDCDEGVANTYDQDRLILRHYHGEKRIPRDA